MLPAPQGWGLEVKSHQARGQPRGVAFKESEGPPSHHSEAVGELGRMGRLSGDNSCSLEDRASVDGPEYEPFLGQAFTSGAQQM